MGDSNLGEHEEINKQDDDQELWPNFPHSAESNPDKENSKDEIASPGEDQDESGDNLSSCDEKMSDFQSDDSGSKLSAIGHETIFNKNSAYDTDRVPFSELLANHSKQFVWGFEFGEVNRRLAERNMKIAKDKTLKESSKTESALAKSEETDLVNKPSCSKAISENDHKTPHSSRRVRVCGVKRPFGSTCSGSLEGNRRIPFPMKKCLDNVETWNYMINREEAAIHLRNPRLFYDFKTVTPRMRAILLDWLMEVAEVYHLRRVTYYLSVDYFDRFLTIRPDIPKNRLQLVGITCLYIAAKVEEIYPPNLSEFAYVCDGACQAKDMISCELLILNCLGWETCATTPSDWLNVYLQLLYKYDDFMKKPDFRMDLTQEFMFPVYSAYQFSRASQLMDLFSLDPGFLRFRYSTVAAAAIYFMYGREISNIVSGICWEELKPCAEYMAVFFKIIKDASDPRLKSCLGGPASDDMSLTVSASAKQRIEDRNENYSYQTHTANMQYFEQASILRLSVLTGRLQQIYLNDQLLIVKHPPKTPPISEVVPVSPSKKECKRQSEPATPNTEQLVQPSASKRIGDSFGDYVESEYGIDRELLLLEEQLRESGVASPLSPIPDFTINIPSKGKAEAKTESVDNSNNELLNFDEILDLILKAEKKELEENE